MASPMEIAMREMGALIAAAASPQSAIDALRAEYTNSLNARNGFNANAIMNGNFDVWQRGTGFTANNTYTADRWISNRDGSGGFTNVSQVPFTVGQPEVPGEPKYYLRKECTVAPTGQTFNVIQQKIESVRTFAGKTVTLSFYGKMDAIRNGTIIVVQNFGSGGSTSVNAAVQSVAYPTAFQKMSITFTLPSILGKTIGANDCLEIQLHSPLNSVFTHDIAQVELCAGDTALPFQPKDVGEETNKSLRFNKRVSNSSAALTVFGNGFSTTTTLAKIFIPFGVRMRIVPTLTTNGSLGLNIAGTILVVTSISIDANGSSVDGVVLLVGVAAGLTAGQGANLIANSDATAYLNFDAELA